MINKNIANIVFYSYGLGETEKEACIFYDDGSFEQVPYEDGIEACMEVLEDKNINTVGGLKDIINNDMIYAMSANEFCSKFNNFLESSKKASESSDENKEKEQEEDRQYDDEYYDFDEDGNVTSFNWNKYRNSTDYEPSDYISKLKKDNNSASKDEISEEEQEEHDLDSNETSNDNLDTSEDIEEDLSNDKDEKKKKKKSFFSKMKDRLKNAWKKITKSKFVRRLTLFVAGFLTATGLYTAKAHVSKTGEMVNSNITSEDTISEENTSIIDSKEDIVLNNDNYNNYSYDELLNVTYNQSQNKAMKKAGNAIRKFNGKFADAYIESDKDIRASLTFDEVVALQNAYNDYSKDEIKAYFNGAEINANDMAFDYKSGTQQLMGAYVIETKENPVNMKYLLNGTKEKEFYERFHDMYRDAKLATGKDQLEKAKTFKDAVIQEFPITEEVRTEGIMHRIDYDKVESYKLSVVPMISAAEMIFQNLDVDFTLNDGEIDFLNDIGLCNYAQDKFERIDTITLNAEEDKTNPTFEQYKNAMIKELQEKGQYVTEDNRRNLSDLDAFQSVVNWHFDIGEDGKFTNKVTTTTSSETKTWTTQSTTYREETTEEKKDIPAKEKKKIDKKIEKENKKAKKEGEKKAKETQEQMQQEADEEAEKIKQEVEADEEDMQNKIDEANDTINNNNTDNDTSNDTPVNEGDFGDHEVDFDDDHSDDNGDLDDSVKDITTDSEGDQTGVDLPGPNQTGAKFDQSQATSYNNLFEYEAESQKSNEELVDEYIESLANSSEEAVNETGYSYTKK